MATKATVNSSGSEEDVINERKRKRMLSNRESARRSRMRKQRRLDDLIHQVAQLKDENSRITLQTNMVTAQYIRKESENNALRAQVTELSERLKSMSEVLRLQKDVDGMMMMMVNVEPEMSDPLLKPWKLPCPPPPVIASANMFE